MVRTCYPNARERHVHGTSAGSHVVGGSEYGQLLEVDLANGTVTPKVRGLLAIWDYVSASIVCDDMLYAVATNAPIAMGMLVVNLTSHIRSYPPTESKLTHAIQCGKQPGILNLVMSEFTTPPTFSLRSYNVTSQATTLIGTFPAVAYGGWDSIFRFADDEVWAVFPKKPDIFGNIQTGELIVMGTETGELVTRKDFEGHARLAL